jgi:hypothetical protein
LGPLGSKALLVPLVRPGLAVAPAPQDLLDQQGSLVLLAMPGLKGDLGLRERLGILGR